MENLIKKEHEYEDKFDKWNKLLKSLSFTSIFEIWPPKKLT